jgi:hypothetical protein
MNFAKIDSTEKIFHQFVYPLKEKMGFWLLQSGLSDKTKGF